MTLTLGIDLATEPARTGHVLMRWFSGGAEVVEAGVGATDDELVGLAQNGATVGIDSPLGWPDSFIDFVTAHRDGRFAGPHEWESAAERRRGLANRFTDVLVRGETGLVPLSVSTDRLGLVAMRCASLVASLVPSVGAWDRSGREPVFEVYPAATLRIWNLSAKGYKKDPAVRDALLRQIEVEASWLDFGDTRELFVHSDHAFDALISSLAARAAQRGSFVPPPSELLPQIAREGWIVLPTVSLSQLA